MTFPSAQVSAPALEKTIVGPPEGKWLPRRLAVIELN
jgi:hypothetical protein